MNKGIVCPEFRVNSNFTLGDYGACELMYREYRAHIKELIPLSVILSVVLILSSISITSVSGANTISVLSPNDSEIWQRGRTKTIEWSSSGAVGSTVDIDLYKDGIFERNIVSGTSNDGSYSWGISIGIAADIDYTIKITSSTQSSIFDFSDSYFTMGLDRLIFSGYSWRVRDTQGSPSGPGPNIFSSSPENVWLDSDGKLHLKITYKNGIWYTAEIYSDESFGYGLYTFFTGSRVDTIDMNSILGLFTYLDDNNEIDIEFARWGWAGGTNLDYVCQPGQTPGNAHSFNFAIAENYSTHSFNWQASEINYRSLYGHYYEPPSPAHVIQTWNYTGPDIPPESTERTHMNLWLMGGNPPSDGQEIEIVITEFNFTDLSQAPTLNPQPSFSIPSAGSIFTPGETITFDWSDVTPNTGNVHYQLEWTQDPYNTDSQGRYDTGGSWIGNTSDYSLLINSPGTWYYHVYAYDDGGEFGELSDGPGPWDEEYFVIPDIPALPMDLKTELYPPGSLSDVRLSWNASSDDGTGENDVIEYVIYRSTDIIGPYLNLSSVFADGSPSYSYTDSGAGDGDFTNYYYRVHAKDDQGKERQSEGRGVKWATYLDTGWNQFSIPLVLESTAREDVLATIEGNYLEVQGYENGASNPWLHWKGEKPAQFNDRFDINYGNGYYINMEVSDYLVTAGQLSTQTDYNLKAGWNFVGSPFITSISREDLNLPASVDYVEYYDISTGSNSPKSYDPISDSGDLMNLDPGQGFWLHSKSDSAFTFSDKIYEQPETQNWEEIGNWWEEIVEIATEKWGLDDPYFVASLVKKESWFNASAYNAAEKASYESGDDNWFGEYYGKGLLQITGSWIAGVPYPNSSEWIYNMPPTAIYEEAPELLDAYNGSQNLDRGIWYIKSLMNYYDNDQYKVATAYRYGWQGLDAGDYDPYNNGYVTDVFGYKQEYLDNIGLSEVQYPNY